MFKPEYDYTTICHSINTVALVVNYYRMFKEDFSDISIEEVILGSLLHDVGKFEMMNLVQSNRIFSESEKQIVMEHPKIGYEVALKMDIRSKNILSAIYNHHRRIDGTGYPNLREDLPLTHFDILVGLVDSFEAMTSDKRPYRKAVPYTKALEILKQDSLENKYPFEMYLKFVESVSPTPSCIQVPQLEYLASY